LGPFFSSSQCKKVKASSQRYTKEDVMETKHTIILGSSQQMYEIADSSIQLIITSPPYPMIKMWDSHFGRANPKIVTLWSELQDSGREKIVTQIYKAMHDDLAKVWREAFRVLIEGGIACINIGDATRTVNGKFRLFPNHSQVIENCEKTGFTTLPYILWKKPTTKPKYKGKGTFLGSGFLPPNAYVTLDCEFVLIFRKGKLRRFPPKDPRRYDSTFTKKQRNEWFTQIWDIIGTRQTTTQLERRIAAFPDEIVNRLIRMFSLKGDTVLDPFLGSGTTTKIAMQSERNSIGYEKDETLLPLIRKKTNCEPMAFKLKIIKREN
jgi:site-specific DNA-methyltransferase (cytosine-N4-specific)